MSYTLFDSVLCWILLVGVTSPDAPVESTAELWRNGGSIVNEATWFIAYGIDAVQDWLFAQRRR